MSKESLIQQDVYFDDVNPADFYGVNNVNLELIQNAYPDVRFVARGNAIKTLGSAAQLAIVTRVLENVLQEIRLHGAISRQRVIELLQAGAEPLPLAVQDPRLSDPDVILRGPNNIIIKARTEGQKAMVRALKTNDILFAIGPAGSGKTYTAVALAVRALKEKEVKKIVLVRPAVEAGERLGFLPGDLKEKIDPYLRPLYDALEDMVMREKLETYLEKNIIEIAPLAYMRGRTLNHAFIILDEAQNATELQMKMLLTRMGAEAKMIITGDETQIDLPRNIRSGLIQCARILQNIEGISFVRLTDKDVVRHRLVRHIIRAYESDRHHNHNTEVLDESPKPPKG